jgi:hypothetical protein
MGSTTGVDWGRTKANGERVSHAPIDGNALAAVFKASDADYE